MPTMTDRGYVPTDTSYVDLPYHIANPPRKRVATFERRGTGAPIARLYKEMHMMPADVQPKMSALMTAEWILAEVYKHQPQGARWPKPYFGVAVDYGVDIYWKRGNDVVKAHVSQTGSGGYVYAALRDESQVYMKHSPPEIMTFMARLCSDD